MSLVLSDRQLRERVAGAEDPDEAAQLHVELAAARRRAAQEPSGAARARQLGELSDELERAHPGSRRVAASSTFEDLYGPGATGMSGHRGAHRDLRRQLKMSNEQAAEERRRRTEDDEELRRAQDRGTRRGHGGAGRPDRRTHRKGGAARRRARSRTPLARAGRPAGQQVLQSTAAGEAGSASGLFFDFLTSGIVLAIVYLAIGSKHGPRVISGVVSGIGGAFARLASPTGGLFHGAPHGAAAAAAPGSAPVSSANTNLPGPSRPAAGTRLIRPSSRGPIVSPIFGPIDPTAVLPQVLTPIPGG